MAVTLDNEFADLILKFTGKAGIALTEQQAHLLSLHIQLMLQWNTRLNLTRITGREEIIVKHLLDSILPAKFLPSSGNALDVGTGAGFPGIPLKIVYPGLRYGSARLEHEEGQFSSHCGRRAGSERNTGTAWQMAGLLQGGRTLR